MMRYYYRSTLLLLLLLVLAFFGTIPISVVSAEPVNFTEECPDKIETVDFYQIQKMQKKDGSGPITGPPPASLSGLKELKGYVYVEIASTQLTADPSLRFMEFYANVPEESNDCKADGTLIELSDKDAIVTDEWIEYEEYQTDGYCVPRTKNGAVVAIGFTFPNPLYTEPTNMVIYDPLGGSSKDGSIELCVRVGYVQQNVGGELITFDDTKITGIVDLTAEFGGETFAVPIQGVEATDLDTDIVCNIAITTFICGTNGANNGRPRSDSYDLGQDFRVCVDIEQEFQEDYKITDFTRVSSGNEQQIRYLVLEGETDELSVVDTTNVVGSSNMKGTVVASAQAIAIDSVITAGFFGDETMDSFDCSGSVDIVYIGVNGNAKCNTPPSLPPPPTSLPTIAPVVVEPDPVPTAAPTNAPSQAPTDTPTAAPTTKAPTDVPTTTPTSPTCWTYQEGYLETTTHTNCGSQTYDDLEEAKAACVADLAGFGIAKQKNLCNGEYRTNIPEDADWKFFDNWQPYNLWSYQLDDRTGAACTPTATPTNAPTITQAPSDTPSSPTIAPVVVEPTPRPTDVPRTCWTYQEGYYDKGTFKYCLSEAWDDVAKAQAASEADHECFGIHQQSHLCDNKFRKTKKKARWMYFSNGEIYQFHAYRLDLPCTPIPCWTYLEGYRDIITHKHGCSEAYVELVEAQAACVADLKCSGIHKMNHKCEGKYRKTPLNAIWEYSTYWASFDIVAYRLDDRTCAANSRHLNLSPSTSPRHLNSQEKEQSAAVLAVVASKNSASFATTIKLSTIIEKDSGTAIPYHRGTIMTITFSLLLALVSHFLCL